MTNSALLTKVAAIVDRDKNDASNDNMNGGNIIFPLLFIFEIMHFTVVSFQLGHINEEGHNDSNIPDTEGREKDTNDNSK